MEKVESTLAKYLEFKVFELFKSQLLNSITPHCREGSKEDLYNHLFLCPAQLSKQRNFQLRGVLSPFVCLWRTSPLNWNTDFYSRSVLYRDFEYPTTTGEYHVERGFLYDFQITFELFSSSYYKDFRDRVNMDLLDTDRLRYFDFDVKELLTNCARWRTRGEVKLTGLQMTDNLDEKQNRSFDLNATYTIKVSLPYCKGFTYLDGLEVYLNSNLIFQRTAEAVS